MVLSSSNRRDANVLQLLKLYRRYFDPLHIYDKSHEPLLQIILMLSTV